MKKIFLLLFIPFISFGQETPKEQLKFNPDMPVIHTQASCGKCMLNMAGNTCELAVKIKDSYYYVEGTGIHDHGGAHSEKGFCNSIRNADVQGILIENRFHVTYFELKKDKD